MHAALSHSGPHRWLPTAVLGALVVAALSGGGDWLLAQGVGMVRDFSGQTGVETMDRIDTFGSQAMIRPAPSRAAAAAALHAMEVALGRLAAQDEAALREPFLGVRLAGTALMAGGLPLPIRRLTEQNLARSAQQFSVRLADVTIPAGVRADLAADMAAYDRAVLTSRPGEGVTPDTIVLGDDTHAVAANP
jgi:hypothetical protein